MKLLNREPTEEMIRAACDVKGMSLPTYREWWIEHFQAMYDAAPELKVGMEPFGYVWVCIDADGRCIGDGFQQIRPPEGVSYYPIYSPEQIATLQTENERLQKANELLKDALSECQCDLINEESSDVRLTVERGELVNVICSALAKYKGEKEI